MTVRNPTPQETRVWDPWVRISHWILAAAFFVAYLVEEPEGLHVWLGYLIGTLVLVRVAWGFLGPRHARFSDFVPSPITLKTYLGRLVRGREPRFLGHNPLGGVMVVALLGALALTAVTGLMVYGAEEQRGPLGSWYAQETAAPAPIPAAYADDHGEDGEEHSGGEAEALEEVHELAANLTLALVGLHVGGVLFTGWRHGENLVRAMINGRKRTE
ncbi:MAG: cytochrome b/b6 domain-containing protein [Thiohalorhabdus sp.]